MNSYDRFEPRKSPVQSRSRALCEAIVDAAAQVLAESGYAGATTNNIAQRAGVSIGSLYEYFPTKDAIFTALIRRTDQRTFELLMANFACISTMSANELLEEILKARIKAALEFPLLESMLRSKLPNELFEAQAHESFRTISSAWMMFAEAHADKIRINDISTALELGHVVVEQTVRHFAVHRPERLRDAVFVQEFSDLMTRYILKDQI